MTRKYLGVNENMTVRWLMECKNCSFCVEDAIDCHDYNDGGMWPGLQTHIWEDHGDQEYCLNCHVWLEDVNFAEHLWNEHSKTWKGMNSPHDVGGGFASDEP